MPHRSPPLLPNFLVIGAQKCGTTSLCAVLGRHPDVFMSEPKEPQFFAVDDRYNKGLEQYAKLFARVGGESAVGEGSTTYTMQAIAPRAAERVAKHLPEARLIYIVRHPMRRLESAYMHLKFTGRTHAAFEDAIEQFPSLIDTTLYWKQLTAYRSHYPDSRIRVVTFEDFVRQPIQVVQELLEFLDVDARLFEAEWLQQLNVSKGRRFDKAVLSRARAHPLYDSASRFIPGWIKHAVKRALTESIRERPVLPAVKRAEVLQRIREDARHILQFCGKPRDYWDLDN